MDLPGPMQSGGKCGFWPEPSRLVLLRAGGLLFLQKWWRMALVQPADKGNLPTPDHLPAKGPGRGVGAWAGLFWIALLACAVGGGYLTRDRWLFRVFPAQERVDESDEEGHQAPATAQGGQVTLSPQAQKNLGMNSAALKVESFWQTVSIPGMVIDRQGFSDRGVVAPATGVVSRIFRVPGDTIRVGDPLFTIRLLSESLHLTQSDLFKATQDIRLALAQKERLAGLGDAVSGSRIIEVDNQITRLQVASKAYRQELLNRGLGGPQVDGVAEGKFVSEITIVAPPPPVPAKTPGGAGDPAGVGLNLLEIQDLKTEVGHQVQAGQTLCLIANHQLLSIQGRAFRDELPLLETSLRGGVPIQADFGENDTADWPPLDRPLTIYSVSNSMDPESRTFHCTVQFENQFKLIERDGRTQVFWRFRPGQRVRLKLPARKLDNVFVLPPGAVAREGAEAYVFRQNGEVFDRKPVAVVHQDRDRVVIANDGSVPPGIFVAQSGAAVLNRMVKSQAGGAPKGFHIHADGSVHVGGH